MTTVPAAPVASTPLPPALRRAGSVLLAGVAAGLVDLVYASGAAVLAGREAASPWRAVARGWFADGANTAGAPLVAIGVLTHFAIAVAAMSVLAVTLGTPLLRNRPRATALLFGAGLYAVMHYLVIPLRWPQVGWRWDGWTSTAEVLAHLAFALAGAAVLRLAGRTRLKGTA